MDWIMKQLAKVVLPYAHDWLVKNWKTSLATAVTLLCTQYVPALAPYKDAILQAALAICGIIFAKDALKSNDPPPPAQPAEPGYSGTTTPGA